MKTSNKLMAMLLVAALAFSVVAIGADNSTISDADVSSDTTELQALIDAGGTVKLEKNYNVAQITVESGTTVILDLNGFIIETTEKSTGRNYYIDNYGTLTITDSNSTKENSRTLGSGYGFMKSDGSEVETGTVTILGGYIWARGVENLDSGKLTINGGTIIDCNTAGAAVWNESELTMNGGTLRSIYIGSAGDNYGPGCLNNQVGASATISKGSFLAASARTYAIISSGTINITPQNDSDILVRGQHGGLAIDGGTGTVRGGTYSSLNFYGLYVSNDGVGESSITAIVSIYGGSYTGNTTSALIGSDVEEEVYSVIDIHGGNFAKKLSVQSNVKSYGIKIFGGTYAGEDPSAYVATGYEAVESSGTWTVSPKTTTVTVDMNCDDLTNDPTFTIKYDASTMTEWNAGSSGVADYSGMQSARSGYTFGGLYEDSACTASKIVMNVDGTLNSQSSYVTEGKWKVDAETKTLYAKWIATYTVSFETNGGTEIKSQTILEGAKASKPSDPTRDGYVFKGWFTDQEFTSSYDFSTQVTSSFTLYAKWEETAATLYSVTFHVDGSPVYVAQVKEGSVVSKPTDPTKDGYRFSGWYTEEACETKYVFTTPVTQNMSLYAGWVQKYIVSIPSASADLGYTVTGSGTYSVEIGDKVNFTVTTSAGYQATIYFNDVKQGNTQEQSTSTVYTVSGYSVNVSVKIESNAVGSTEKTTEEQSVTENDDDTITETNTRTTTDETSSTTTIEEVSEVKDSAESTEVKQTTTAKAEFVEGTGTSENVATISIETTSDEEVIVSPTMAKAISDLATASDNPTVVILEVEPTKITVPSLILDNESITGVRMVVNLDSYRETAVTVPTSALVDMAETVSIQVTDSSKSTPASASSGATVGASFDMNVVGADSVFNDYLTISYKMDLPNGADADSVTVYCVDTDEYFDAVYENGAVTFKTRHFSTYSAIFDVLPIIIEDDDDALFILELQRKAREAAAAAQTTTGDNSGEEAAVIIAAAAVAGAMLACAFFAFRKS